MPRDGAIIFGDLIGNSDNVLGVITNPAWSFER
jgi:hypothetical protein